MGFLRTIDLNGFQWSVERPEAKSCGLHPAPFEPPANSAQLSSTGTEPATHWISSGLIDESFAAILSSPEALYGYAQAGALEQGLTLTATAEDAAALVEQTDVSTDSATDAMSRLGLVMVSDNEI